MFSKEGPEKNNNGGLFAPLPPDDKISVQLNCSQEKLAAIAQIATNGGYGKLIGQPGVQVIDAGAGYTGFKGHSGDDAPPQTSVTPIPLAAMFDYNTDYPENIDLYEKGVSPGKSRMVTQTSAAMKLSDGGTTEGEQISIDPIETFFSPGAIDEMAKGACDYLSGSNSIPEGYRDIGKGAAAAMLNNPNIKTFMRSRDSETAEFISEHFRGRLDAENTVSGSQIVDPHGDPELVQKIVAVAADEGRNSDFLPVVAKNINDANLAGPCGGDKLKIEQAGQRPGMTLLAERMLQQDLDAGHKVVIFDPKGQSIEAEIKRFTSTLPRMDSPGAIEQIKKAVKEFRVAWQPAAGKQPSLTQTYQLVAKALGFKTWEAMAVAGKNNMDGCIPLKTLDPTKIFLSDDDRKKHIAFFGKTGSGKSMLSDPDAARHLLKTCPAMSSAIASLVMGWHIHEDDNRQCWRNETGDIQTWDSGNGVKYNLCAKPPYLFGTNNDMEFSPTGNEYHLELVKKKANEMGVTFGSVSGLSWAVEMAYKGAKRVIRRTKSTPKYVANEYLFCEGLLVVMGKMFCVLDAPGIARSTTTTMRYTENGGELLHTVLNNGGQLVYFDSDAEKKHKFALSIMDAGDAEEVANILFKMADIEPQAAELETIVQIVKGLPDDACLRTFIKACNKTAADQLGCTPEQLEAISPLLKALAAFIEPGRFGRLFTGGDGSV